MKNFFLFFIVLFSLNNLSNAKENLASVDSLFHIDQYGIGYLQMLNFL